MLAEGELNLLQPDESSDSCDQAPPRPPRRAVPTTFNPIINDEANILCHIARGDLTLVELAIKYETTVSNFCIWLQREDIQQKLSDLTTCGAQLTRVAAVNQLPKAVQAMASQIDGYEFDRGHNLIKPGLAADKVAAQRDANVRKAANLLLRLARFDPSRPLYSPRPPRSHALSSTSPKGEVPTQPGVGAPDLSTCSSSHASSSLPTSDIAVGAPALTTSPTCSLPSTSDFFSGIEFAQAFDDAAKRHAPSSPTIDELLQAVRATGILNTLPQRGSAARRETNAAFFPTSPKGEVPAQPGVGAPAFSSASSRPPPSTSHFPAPTSDIVHGRAPPRAMSWL